MPLTAGTRVGPFLIAARIGSGGMGEVYRASDTRLGRDVALKVLREGFALDEGRVRRFEQEARAAAAVTDPHIVVLYDVGTHDGAPYLVTELLEGRSLRDELDGALPRAKVLDYGRQLASALIAAHARGVVHRDLKPENLFVTSGGVLKVLDFGIARLMHAPSSGDTETGSVLGTVGYMAPEQVRGQSADHRADLFAAGCILYELASGKRAFHGATSVETGYAVLNSEPPALDDAALDAVVRRCLEKSLEGRMPSASELDAALAGVGSGAAPVRPHAGRRAWPSFIALAVALVAAGGGWMFLRGSRGRAVTDYPAPEGKPEAQREYRIGLQAVRDASLSTATQAFERAARLDPSMPAADLRAALYADNPSTLQARTKHLAAAEHQRDRLDARDQALLDIAGGLTRNMYGNDDATSAVAREAVARFPNDAELRLARARVLFNVDSSGTSAELDRALELDPRFATAEVFKSGQIGRHTDGRPSKAHIDRCLEISPTSLTCLVNRAALRSIEGDCAGFEADARKLAEREPDDAIAQDTLFQALAATHAPSASLEAALARVAAATPEGRERTFVERLNAVRLALLQGDFLRAQQDLVAIQGLVANDSAAAAHSGPAITLIFLLEEMGDVDGALKVADDYVQQSSAFIAPDGFIVEVQRLAMLRQLHRVSDSEYQKAMADVRVRLEQWLPAGMPASDRHRDVWMGLNRSFAAETPEQAAADLADVPSDFLWFNQILVGKRYLEAGRLEPALRLLRSSAANCDFTVPLQDEWWQDTFMKVQSYLLLGDALERSGDKTGACAPYASVIAQWKNAKPRSVSVEKALERSKALGCLTAE
jgi:hypothetical protein